MPETAVQTRRLTIAEALREAIAFSLIGVSMIRSCPNSSTSPR